MKLLCFLLPVALSACASTSSAPDGSVDPGPDASMDAGIDAGMDASVSERRVFVTSARQNADFGGIDGADELCASEALAAGLDGEFRAWLSTLSSPVADRLEQSTVPYVLVDGTRIADDWTDLTDGDIQARIDRDASGAQQGGDVWTGTLPDGQPFLGGDCDGFRSGGSGTLSLCGTTQSTLANWTDNQTPSCSTQLRLFCFEQ